MPDYIVIKDLLLRTIIGINSVEREHRQDVNIAVRVQTDLQKAGHSDKIEDTLNYRTLCKQIIELVEGSEFSLVERMAEEIAAIALRHKETERVWVSVEKPGALRFARTVSVEIERSRDGS